MNEKIKFKILKVDFIISFPFLSMICLMLLLDEVGNSLYTIIAFIIHELSHITAIIIFGGKVSTVKFSLCEMNIKINKDILKPFQLIIVEVSGTLSNLILAYLLYNINKQFCIINLTIGLFQLLPITSLDGDNILAVLGINSIIRKIISLIMSFFIFLFGFYIVIKTGYNISLILLSIYFIIETLKKRT